MIQDQNNHIIEEISEEQLHAIIGGGCSHCTQIAEQAEKTANKLQEIKNSNPTNVPPLIDKAIETYQKLAQHTRCCQGEGHPTPRGCVGCDEHSTQLYMLDDLSHRAGLNIH